MEKFKWCFIGTGKLAKNVAQQLLDSGRHEIVSCYTRNFDNAKAFADQFGGTAYAQAADAITAEGVEGVYIVVTQNAHHRFTKLALELGKPVLCEKAFTVTASEADDLIALAREKGVYLCEAMWTWFSPSANQVKKWIDEEKIGPIKSAHFTYHLKSINYSQRVSDPRRAGGALLDITVYPITYAYRLWGMPEKIESVGHIENGIDHSEDIVFIYPGGMQVTISASLVDMKGFEKMRIVGEKGRIEAMMYHCMNGVTCKQGLFQKEVFKGPGPKINSYLDEFDTVAQEIRSGLTESRMVPLQATSDVMHIIDTVARQIGLAYTDLE